MADVLVAVVRRPAGDVLPDVDEQHLGPDSRFQVQLQVDDENELMKRKKTWFKKVIAIRIT